METSKRKTIKDAVNTLNLTMILIFNLFFIVFLVLTLITVLVFFGVDNGFFYRDGMITIGGALVTMYSACIFIAISVVVMVRLVILSPIQKIMEKMQQLAAGDFSARVFSENEGFVPGEIRAFGEGFNKAAAELGSTEILRKDFINNFSHEFKTPIVSINGFADLLLEEDLPEEDRKEYLTIIRDESKRLASLSNHILMLSRLDSQSILTDTTEFSLDEQIRQALLVTEQKWAKKEPQFNVRLEDVTYCGNEALLKEVWLNLLDNAVKFSPDRGQISVVLRKEQGRIIFSVTDQGEGIPEENQTHIFDQFYQGDTSHKTQGNGLGLAMVKKIIELHKGTIAVNSKPGCGSCFTVKL